MTEKEPGKFPEELRIGIEKTIAEKAKTEATEKMKVIDKRCENCMYAWPSETKNIYRMAGARWAIVGRLLVCGNHKQDLFMVPLLEKKPGCKNWKEIEKKS